MLVFACRSPCRYFAADYAYSERHAKKIAASHATMLAAAAATPCALVAYMLLMLFDFVDADIMLSPLCLCHVCCCHMLRASMRAFDYFFERPPR